MNNLGSWKETGDIAIATNTHPFESAKTVYFDPVSFPKSHAKLKLSASSTHI